jgi:hypothetical protein
MSIACQNPYEESNHSPAAEQATALLPPRRTRKQLLWLGLAMLTAGGFSYLCVITGNTASRETASGHFGLLLVASLIGLLTSMIGANLAVCGVIVFAIQTVRPHSKSNTDNGC